MACGPCTENAILNRELAALKRMFSIARRSTPPKVNAASYIAMLREDNVRTGFLESKQHDNLAAETGKVALWLRAMFEVGYKYGWRHEELQDLRVSQVNVAAGTIRLEPGTTKNSEGREVTMTLPVRTLLTQCVQGKRPDDCVFTREDGKPVRGFPGRLDQRVQGGKGPGIVVPRPTQDSGAEPSPCWSRGRGDHEDRRLKTRSVFERYAIVSQSDIQDAMTKLEARQQRDNAEAAQEKNQRKITLGRVWAESSLRALIQTAVPL